MVLMGIASVCKKQQTQWHRGECVWAQEEQKSKKKNKNHIYTFFYPFINFQLYLFHFVPQELIAHYTVQTKKATQISRLAGKDLKTLGFIRIKCYNPLDPAHISLSFILHVACGPVFCRYRLPPAGLTFNVGFLPLLTVQWMIAATILLYYCAAEHTIAALCWYFQVRTICSQTCQWLLLRTSGMVCWQAIIIQRLFS